VILKEWDEKIITVPKNASLAGFMMGLKYPTVCGQRFMADYHYGIDSERFEKWFQDQLLLNIRPGSVIVMEDAGFQRHRSELLLTAAWRKADIKQWLLVIS
jgi:hypothetical protein